MVLITPVLWEKAMENIRSSIGEEAFTAWISPVTMNDFDEENAHLQLTVPNRFYLRWIEKRYLPEIEAAFKEILTDDLSLSITCEEDDHQEVSQSNGFPGSKTNRLQEVQQNGNGHSIGNSRRAQIFGETPASQDRLIPSTTGSEFNRASTRMKSDSITEISPEPRLNPRYVFEDFVVGESNRYAHAAATAVADPNGKAFNPLFIYGQSGLGKTHLMQAIGQRAYHLNQSLHVLYVTSEQFINGFIDSIQNKKHMEFREAYRNVDLLLIDDVQFLMGKERTQTEFFHTFNALYDAGKKVVVTSDRPPKDLAALEDRLRSRFEWGLLVDIQSPDLETRIAILKKKAEKEDIELSNEVIFFIAERVKDNIREMEGALKRLKMASSLHNRPVDLEMTRDVLGHLMIGQPQPRVTIEDVQRSVCAYFGIKVTDLLGKNRSKKYSQPRHLAQYLCRQLTSYSFPDIAQKFGGKDHTSIIYACRKVESAIEKDPNMANIVQYLTKQVTKG